MYNVEKDGAYNIHSVFSYQMCLLLFLSILRGKERFSLSALGQMRIPFGECSKSFWMLRLDMDWDASDVRTQCVGTTQRLTVKEQLMSFLNRWENMHNRDAYMLRCSGLDADTYEPNKELKIIPCCSSCDLFHAHVSRGRWTWSRAKTLRVLFMFDCSASIANDYDLQKEKQNKTIQIQQPINALFLFFFFFVPFVSVVFSYWHHSNNRQHQVTMKTGEHSPRLRACDDLKAFPMPSMLKWFHFVFAFQYFFLFSEFTSKVLPIWMERTTIILPDDYDLCK